MFSNYWFAAFSCIFFALYWSALRAFPRKVVLLVACCVFYGHYAGAAGIAPIAVLALATYLAGLSGSKAAMILAIVANVAALAFYKYIGFFLGSAVSVLGERGAWLAQVQKDATAAIAVPLAISFFVFEFVHYLVDLLHGARPIRSPLRFALFASFFPTVVAGPIKRYEQFLPALEAGCAGFDAETIAKGLLRVTIGLTKKLLIADFLTGYVTTWQPYLPALPLSGRWLFFAALDFRILFDFSGYSDIAIGLALMMGIRVPENFNWPYLATSVQEFWRRWHISLSSWIRDYVYIPLGGSRHGLPRKIANGLFAFALCGLWHGAAWNFVLWGVYHGAGLVISANYAQALGPAGRGLRRVLSYVPPVKWAVTQLFVMIGWLYFFYPVGEATRMLKLLFPLGS